MSAPDTNVKRQEKEHRPALFGIGFSLLWGTVLLIGLVLWVVFNGNEPGDGEAVDGTAAPTEQAAPANGDPITDDRATAPATGDGATAPASGAANTDAAPTENRPAAQPPATTQ